MDTSAVITLASTLVVAAATVLLAGLTYKYVRLTQGLLEEARAAKEPSVTVDLEFPDHWGRLVVANTGGGSAHRVRFAVARDVPGLALPPKKGGIAELSTVSNGISFLRAGQSFRLTIRHPREWPTEPDQQVVSLSVRYENQSGRAFSRDFTIDLLQFVEVNPESFRDPTSAVAKAIRDSDDRRRSELSSRRLFASFRSRS